MIEISPRDARRLFLQRQGLLRNGQFGRGKQAALRAIEQLGYVQIDTISVLDRAHHHVLKTRVPNYNESMLDRLLSRDRRIFEYWAHAAAYLPMTDYRYSRPMMAGFQSRPLPDRKLAREIIERIRVDGPLQSRHFENPEGRNSSGWWDWKPAKLALEHLFLRGELMVSRRDGFQKVFDLPVNVLPEDVDTSMPSRSEWCRFIVLRMLGALGVATAMDIGYARTTIRKFTGKPIQNELAQTLDSLVDQGRLCRVKVGTQPMYALPELLESLPIRLGRRLLWFLSPFDNLVINRDRLTRLFGFDYQIECYVPEAKRQYGYYCLPVLWGDKLIGRLDARADRSKQLLQVQLLHLEPGVKVDDPLLAALAPGLDQLARANSCDQVRIQRTEPAPLKAALVSRLP